MKNVAVRIMIVAALAAAVALALAGSRRHAGACSYPLDLRRVTDMNR